MRIVIEKDRLRLEPETDFESEWCVSFLSHGEVGVAWLKCGLSASDILGIVIEQAKKGEQE